MIKHLGNGEKIIPNEEHLQRFTELHGEEKRDEGDRGEQEGNKGNQKGREQSRLINSLCALNSLEHPERFTEFHRKEKRRGRREIEMTRRRRGGVKRGETNLASNQFPKCCPQPRTPSKIHKVERRRIREETEMIWGEKRDSQKGSEQSSQFSHT